MAFDRREREEQLERIRERVRSAVDILAKWEAYMDSAIAKAKASLEELRKSLVKAKV